MLMFHQEIFFFMCETHKRIEEHCGRNLIHTKIEGRFVTFSEADSSEIS